MKVLNFKKMDDFAFHAVMDDLAFHAVAENDINYFVIKQSDNYYSIVQLETISVAKKLLYYGEDLSKAFDACSNHLNETEKLEFKKFSEGGTASYDTMHYDIISNFDGSYLVYVYDEIQRNDLKLGMGSWDKCVAIAENHAFKMLHFKSVFKSCFTAFHGFCQYEVMPVNCFDGVKYNVTVFDHSLDDFSKKSQDLGKFSTIELFAQACNQHAFGR